MKIQCNCGAKYAFDVTEDMLTNPISLVCQTCGADISAAVNQVIQQQLGGAELRSCGVTELQRPPPAVSPQPTVVAPPAEPRAGGPLRVNIGTHSAPPPASAAAAPASAMCSKHPWMAVTDHCVVCSKALCPKCMELFGYVCSPFCKNEAETRGIHVPIYAQQASAVQAAGWRHFRLMTASIVGAIALIIGLWGWYSFSLSKPKPVFSVKFDEKADTGNVRFVTGNDAIVLRGGRLMRYDLKGKKELWRAELVDKMAVAQQAAKAVAAQAKDYEEIKKNPGDLSDRQLRSFEPEPEAVVAQRIADATADGMRLYVYNSNIWVHSDTNLVRYEYETGKPAQQVALKERGEVEMDNDSLVMLGYDDGERRATRVDLNSGQAETHTLASRKPAIVATAVQSNRTGSAGVKLATNRVTATTVAARAGAQPGNLGRFKTERDPSLAEKIAAPAIAASVVRNRQIEGAIADDKVKPDKVDDVTGSRVVMAGGKMLMFGVRMLEEKTIERQAMKAAPTKSALEGDVNQASTVAVANEIFNEFQREHTGGVEIEDVSRYEVTLKGISAEAPEFTGEFIGPPHFIPLKTVNLIAAGKSVTALDQSNRKLWQATLNYEVPQSASWDDEFLGAAAGAPALERDRSIYLRDAGVLACFDLATGNAKWRLPSVGVKHMLFDEKGFLYVETTTASAEKLKYSQQVDISKRDRPLIIKVDPASGKLLWKSENNGRLAYVSGKFIYTLEWQGGIEDKEANPFGIPGAYIPPHVRIRRLSPRNGRVDWEHYQRRGPQDVRFHGNQIEVLFHDEFQVLKFWSL